MIDAKELRIGNWVNSINGYVAIDSINHQRIDTLKNGEPVGWLLPKQIDPIPLTPELLEKCGFKVMYDNGHKFYGFGISGRTALHIEDDGTLSIDIDAPDYRDYPCTDSNEDDIGSIKYLHQLQNLFFALTGKELEIQLL